MAEKVRELARPEAADVSNWATSVVKLVNSVWYVLATLIAFLAFLSAALPQLGGYLGTLGSGIGSAYDFLFQRPVLVRQQAGDAALRSAAPEADGYVYYEVSKTGQLTGDGRLAPIPRQSMLPDLGKLALGQILRAEDEVYLRAGGSPSAQPLGFVSQGSCVRVVEGERIPANVKEARSGGYVPVRRVTCLNTN